MSIRSALQVPSGSYSPVPGTRRRHSSSSIARNSRRSAVVRPLHSANPCMCSFPFSPFRTACRLSFSRLALCSPNRRITAAFTRRS